jgi:chromosome segregation ATPase
VFDERRAEVEGELAEAVARTDAAEAARTEAYTEIAALREQLEQTRAAEAAARANAQRERDAKDSALQRVVDSEQRLASERTAATSRLDGQRDSYEQQLREQRNALAAAEARFREELTRATERLDGVQKHVMLQVAEAREAQKRAEDQLTKAIQRSERLAGELESMRREVLTRTTQLQRSTQDCVGAADNVARLQAERDDLAVRLATTSGRLEAATQQVADLMARVGTPATDMKAAATGKKRSRAAV